MIQGMSVQAMLIWQDQWVTHQTHSTYHRLLGKEGNSASDHRSPHNCQ